MRGMVLVLVILLGLVVLGCAKETLAEAQEAYAHCFLENYRAYLADYPPTIDVAWWADRACPYPSPPRFPTRDEYLVCRERAAQLIGGKYGDLDTAAIQLIEERVKTHLTASMCLVHYRDGFGEHPGPPPPTK